MTPIKITQMDYEDIQKTVQIQTCGTNITKYQNDIIALFKKYIDATENICRNCSLEISLSFKKYEIYFNKFLNENNIIVKKEEEL